ncbi:(2Fe-2S)-binding protein [Arsenophonus sp. ENCA]|uniref:class I ribonucleotide reductase maintenance protein YfaE n=1 Tax=Arsenophonus TaxID=637 RepID=UPI0005097FE2|nr:MULTISPECIES: class I ribonucleotide reductase maintenance protein YfaE [Arsenophonus]MDR5612322.1 class I ribonucleotide reductase maintenance protein YfaE [Arsenophonus sp.]PAV10805.1 (2Fe-2S)-binding protein [Arsenophonus sp. ENCA]
MASYKITLRNAQGILIPFHSEQHTSLLDALEQSKIQIEFQCREGFCGACRVRLRKGKVAYRHKPIAFIDKDEILACSCRPITDIDIDINQ